jgi:hypothetical protein
MNLCLNILRVFLNTFSHYLKSIRNFGMNFDGNVDWEGSTYGFKPLGSWRLGLTFFHWSMKLNLINIIISGIFFIQRCLRKLKWTSKNFQGIFLVFSTKNIIHVMPHLSYLTGSGNNRSIKLYLTPRIIEAIDLIKTNSWRRFLTDDYCRSMDSTRSLSCLHERLGINRVATRREDSNYVMKLRFSPKMQPT